jgi:predicted ribosomally synthesized peptide with SipW-like signal peptide
MKKIAILALSLVLALGVLGIGYAKWSDTVTINGTVNTGTVKVGVLDVGTTDMGTTVDPRVVPQNVDDEPNWQYDLWVADTTDPKNVGSAISTNNGDIKCTCHDVGYYGSITETIANAYPFYNPSINIDIASCGTVPVKIDNVVLSGSTGINPACLAWNWTIVVPQGVNQPAATLTGSGTLEQFVAALGHYQLEQCQVLHITLGVIFLECTPQNTSGSFTITITASQWNEVGIPD